MNELELLQLIGQNQAAQNSDPLINTSDEDMIYIGLGSMAILLIVVVGLFSRRVNVAIIMALIVSAVIIFLVMG